MKTKQDIEQMLDMEIQEVKRCSGFEKSETKDRAELVFESAYYRGRLVAILTQLSVIRSII